MENQKVKKINVPYLLCLIFLPIVSTPAALWHINAPNAGIKL